MKLAAPRFHLAALAATLALVFAACGGSSPSPAAGGDEPSAAGSVEVPPAESMAASEAPPTTAASEAALNPGAAAASISDLDSYQVEIHLAAGDDSTTLTIVSTKTPAATHYSMVGADSMEVITIDGVGSWLKQDGTWVEPPGGADLYLSVFNFLAPDRLVSQYQLGNLVTYFNDMGSEDHNGIASRHLHLDAGDVTGLPAANFPADGMMDLWVAEDGGYLVGMAFSGTEEETGTFSELSVDVSRVNDPSISIEPPA